MKHKLLWILAILFLTPVLWAATVSQRTQGSCSPAIWAGSGNVTVACKGVDRAQVNELIKIFNEGIKSFKEFQQEILHREPEVAVRCGLDDKADPSKLICFVENRGRGEARDVLISFADSLPTDTVVQAPPELGIRIEEAGSPPDPLNSPVSAKLLTAFVVKIPRISAKEKFQFALLTTNDDNLRTAKQVLKIRGEINDVIKTFGARVKEFYPSEAEKWSLEELLRARAKEENFYTPSKFSYEKGRFPVEFLTEAETLAAAVNKDLYARYKPRFIDVFQNRPSYLAPVIRIKSRDGERTYARMPSYITTCIGGIGRVPTPGQKVELPIGVPDYEKDQC